MTKLHLTVAKIGNSTATKDGKQISLHVTDIAGQEISINMPPELSFGAATSLIVAGDAALSAQRIEERPIFKLARSDIGKSPIQGQDECAHILQFEQGGKLFVRLSRPMAESLRDQLTAFLENEMPALPRSGLQ